jgi:hypothetical protein
MALLAREWVSLGCPPRRVHTHFSNSDAQVLKRRWFIVVSTRDCLLVKRSGELTTTLPQVPLVMLVIGTITTTIYLTVIILRIQFANEYTPTIEQNIFFTNCASFRLLRVLVS